MSQNEAHIWTSHSFHKINFLGKQLDLGHIFLQYIFIWYFKRYISFLLQIARKIEDEKDIENTGITLIFHRENNRDTEQL